MTTRIAVIGLGTTGSMTAWHLSRLPGVEVLGFEQFGLGHSYGAFTGESRLFRTAYHFYLQDFMPLVASLFSSNAAAYGYLFESIEAWPAQEEFAGHLREAGWTKVEYRNLTNGVVALHRAEKPSN